MSRLNDCSEFYGFVENVIFQKGDDWFNEWISHNPETNFISPAFDEEVTEMINSGGIELPNGKTKLYTSVDYRAMLKKLKDDLKGQ